MGANTVKELLEEQAKLPNSDIAALAKKVFHFAENEAYEEASEHGANVTGDMVHKNAKAIVKEHAAVLLSKVADLIEKEYS